MRRARVTFEGAYHHAMNRGHDGRRIFATSKEKESFIDLLKETSRIHRIRIFAHCIMDSHYHLALENSSGHMSEFFKQLDGQYGSWYRRTHKGRGYVFQDRFKSFLIQNDAYLQAVIGYVLTNPVRSGLVSDFFSYPWSSARFYFQQQSHEMIDVGYIEELYGTLSNFRDQVNQSVSVDLPIVTTRAGQIIGDKKNAYKILKRFDRRRWQDNVVESKRIDDFYFEPVEKVFHEFKNIHQIRAEDLDTTTYEGKRLRGKLLVYLKDRAGLKYSEIIKFPVFSDVKLHSLGRLYKVAKIQINQSDA